MVGFWLISNSLWATSSQILENIANLEYRLYEIELNSDSVSLKSKDSILFELGRIYFLENNYFRSIQRLNQIKTKEIIKDTNYIYLLSSAYYLSEQYSFCSFTIENTSNYSDLPIKLKILRILALHELGNYDKAISIFNSEVIGQSIFNDSISTQILKLYQKGQPKEKKEIKRFLLGVFIPGGSYFYLNKPKKGALNATFQLTFLGATALLAYHKLYASAVFIGWGLWYKFRDGAEKHTSKYIGEYNSTKKNNYNLELKSLYLSDL
ncbi:MAG: hypothetical protein SNJ77_05465 [Cytophagales bacterium]